jgi:hypothetical protein
MLIFCIFLFVNGSGINFIILMVVKVDMTNVKDVDMKNRTVFTRCKLKFGIRQHSQRTGLFVVCGKCKKVFRTWKLNVSKCDYCRAINPELLNKGGCNES